MQKARGNSHPLQEPAPTCRKFERGSRCTPAVAVPPPCPRRAARKSSARAPAHHHQNPPSHPWSQTQRRKLQKKRSKSSKQHAAAFRDEHASSAAASSASSSISVVVEDAHLIAINKPAGMLCHPSPGFGIRHRRARWLRRRTAGFSEIGAHMLEADAQHTGEDDSFIPRAIVHRLDRGTTGLLSLPNRSLQRTVSPSTLSSGTPPNGTSRCCPACQSPNRRRPFRSAASMQMAACCESTRRSIAIHHERASTASLQMAKRPDIHVHALSSGWSS